jgi:hypothetical protein
MKGSQLCKGVRFAYNFDGYFPIGAADERVRNNLVALAALTDQPTFTNPLLFGTGIHANSSKVGSRQVQIVCALTQSRIAGVSREISSRLRGRHNGRNGPNGFAPAGACDGQNATKVGSRGGTRRGEERLPWIKFKSFGQQANWKKPTRRRELNQSAVMSP